MRARFLVRIDLPDDLWDARLSVSTSFLDVGWNAVPPGKVSPDLGDAWLKDAASPLVPEVASAIVPEESNILLDSRHPDMARLKPTKLRLWQYDGRPGRP
jgi:hypothetical protein